VKVNNYPVGNSDVVQIPVSDLTVYPNPFNPSTTIAFYTPHSMDLSVTLYNIKGQKVRTLHSGRMGMGNHQLVWDGKDELIKHKGGASPLPFFLARITNELRMNYGWDA
jgi:hypothetical protein